MWNSNAMVPTWKAHCPALTRMSCDQHTLIALFLSCMHSTTAAVWHCLPTRMVFRSHAIWPRFMFHICIHCSALNFYPTPTGSGVHGRYKRLAEWMNNSSLQFWTESALAQLFFPTQCHVIKSALFLKKSLRPLGKTKARAVFLDCNFDRHSLARYLSVMKTMQWRATHFHFLPSGCAWIKVSACDSMDLTQRETQTCFLKVASRHFAMSANGKIKKLFVVLCEAALLSNFLVGEEMQDVRGSSWCSSLKCQIRSVGISNRKKNIA